jgi:hypothetical protein
MGNKARSMYLKKWIGNGLMEWSFAWRLLSSKDCFQTVPHGQIKKTARHARLSSENNQANSRGQRASAANFRMAHSLVSTERGGIACRSVRHHTRLDMSIPCVSSRPLARCCGICQVSSVEVKHVVELISESVWVSTLAPGAALRRFGRASSCVRPCLDSRWRWRRCSLQPS